MCIYVYIFVYDAGIDGASIPRTAVTVKGVKEIKALTPTYREHTSLLAIANAAGTALPPLFVFKGTCVHMYVRECVCCVCVHASHHYF